MPKKRDVAEYSDGVNTSQMSDTEHDVSHIVRQSKVEDFCRHSVKMHVFPQLKTPFTVYGMDSQRSGRNFQAMFASQDTNFRS